jgi:hypothetical protein
VTRVVLAKETVVRKDMGYTMDEPNTRNDQPSNTTSTKPPPTRVRLVAAEMGLGHYLTGRATTAPLFSLAVCVILEVGCLGVIQFVTEAQWHTGRRLMVWLLVAAILPILWAAKAIIDGFISVYAYTNALVYVRNGRRRVVEWPEVSKLVVLRGNPKSLARGKVLAYEVRTQTGRRLRVAAMIGRRDELGEELVKQTYRLGRPLVEEIQGSRHRGFLPNWESEWNGLFVLPMVICLFTVPMVVLGLRSADSGYFVMAGVSWAIAAYLYSIWAYINRPEWTPEKTNLLVPIVGVAMGTALLVTSVAMAVVF